MSTLQNKENPSLKYREELEATIKSLRIRIDNKVKHLSIKDSNFEKAFTEINSMRVDLKTKKERLYFLDKPKPYMIDKSNQEVISSYIK